MKRALRSLSFEVLAAAVDINKLVNYLWGISIAVISNPTRWEIFDFIVNYAGETVSFTEIKKAFPKLGNASLVFHLQKLHEAHLITRRAKLDERTTIPEHYYSYYLATLWGKVFWETIVASKQEALRMYAEKLGIPTETDVPGMLRNLKGTILMLPERDAPSKT